MSQESSDTLKWDHKFPWIGGSIFQRYCAWCGTSQKITTDFYTEIQREKSFIQHHSNCISPGDKQNGA